MQILASWPIWSKHLATLMASFQMEIWQSCCLGTSSHCQKCDQTLIPELYQKRLASVTIRNIRGIYIDLGNDSLSCIIPTTTTMSHPFHVCFSFFLFFSFFKRFQHLLFLSLSHSQVNIYKLFQNWLSTIRWKILLQDII